MCPSSVVGPSTRLQESEPHLISVQLPSSTGDPIQPSHHCAYVKATELPNSCIRNADLEKEDKIRMGELVTNTVPVFEMIGTVDATSPKPLPSTLKDTEMVVIKLIPIEGQVLFNGQVQKTYLEVLSEAIVSK
ncbi:unnamed protein product [Protopolystoma xenopodis]|uniref:Uncharacterized protein n=1 Tax=Protopolystoma xenopodis TaxID=117903 RepID=A0A448WX72_9PLAT|nr:unnamed protein product [Protopolystoma xenopodis]